MNATVDKFLQGVIENTPLIVALMIIVWLSLPQLAERFAIVSKMVKPLSRRWQAKAAKLEAERKEIALREAKRLAAEALAEMTPPDVARMEERIKRLDTQLAALEDREALLRAYVIYDELWHFHDDLDLARRGLKPQHRLNFDAFEAKWKAGWRPFDSNGRLQNDGSDSGTQRA